MKFEEAKIKRSDSNDGRKMKLVPAGFVKSTRAAASSSRGAVLHSCTHRLLAPVARCTLRGRRHKRRWLEAAAAAAAAESAAASSAMYYVRAQNESVQKCQQVP